MDELLRLYEEAEKKAIAELKAHRTAMLKKTTDTVSRNPFRRAKQMDAQFFKWAEEQIGNVIPVEFIRRQEAFLTYIRIAAEGYAETPPLKSLADEIAAVGNEEAAHLAIVIALRQLHRDVMACATARLYHTFSPSEERELDDFIRTVTFHFRAGCDAIRRSDS
jgi:hypothetical protein